MPSYSVKPPYILSFILAILWEGWIVIEGVSPSSIFVKLAMLRLRLLPPENRASDEERKSDFEELWHALREVTESFMACCA